MKEQFSLIIDTAIKDGIPVRLAQLIAAQSAHETAGFTSKTFLQNNNGFGYKYVKGAKWQDGAGRTSTENDPYANYKTFEDSIHELTAWIFRRLKEGKFPPLETITKPEQYATILKTCGYYGDPIKNYINGLQHYFNMV